MIKQELIRILEKNSRDKETHLNNMLVELVQNGEISKETIQGMLYYAKTEKQCKAHKELVNNG